MSIKRMRTERLPAHHCLVCDNLNDAGSYLPDGFKLKPGDVSICFKCGHISILDQDMSLRLPTPAEVAELDQDVELKLYKRARLEWLTSKARGVR